MSVSGTEQIKNSSLISLCVTAESLHAEQNKTGRIPEKNQIKMTETEKKTWQ